MTREREITETMLDQSIRELLYSFRKNGGDLDYCVMTLKEDFFKAGYRLPPKLELIGDEQIKAELARIQPEGFDWCENITQSEFIKFRAIANLQLAADQKAIEGVK